MIKLEQVDAALGLLHMNRTQLAERLNIKSATFHSYFTGKSRISADKLARIELFLSQNGIEFIPDGVRKNKNLPIVFEGQKGFRDFYDQLYQTAMNEGGDICIYNGVSQHVSKWLGDHFTVQVERMTKIKDRFRFRVIVEEGDSAFIGSKYCEYKWFPANLFNDNHFYVFGSKVGFVTFEPNTVSVIMIDNAGISKTHLHLFDIAWTQVAMEIPHGG